MFLTAKDLFRMHGTGSLYYQPDRPWEESETGGKQCITQDVNENRGLSLQTPKTCTLLSEGYGEDKTGKQAGLAP
jgi:hypothetical protein